MRGGKAGPDHPPRPAVTVNLGEDVAKHIRDGEKQHPGAEGHDAEQRQIHLADLGRADQVGADKNGDECGHYEFVIAVLPLRLIHGETFLECG